MKSNNIKSISIAGDHGLFFIIEYNNGVRKSFEFDNPQLQQVKSYLQSQSKKSVSQDELQDKTNSLQSESNPNRLNCLPLIISGVLILGVIISLIVWLVIKTKKNTIHE